MPRRFFSIIVVLVLGGSTAPRGRLVAGMLPVFRMGIADGTVGALMASPVTITFQASNPSLGIVSGSSAATITWTIAGGSHLQNWILNIQASSTNLAGCPTVPVSAIQVMCSSASASGGSGTAACNSSFPLSTSSMQVAGGAEGDGTNSYTVLLNFTLAESWRYQANYSCSTTLTYSVNAQ